MQKRKIVKIGLSVLGGMILFLSFKSEVSGALLCSALGFDCGFDAFTTGCWDRNCSNCNYGCSSPSCTGGSGCYSAPSCSQCGTYPNCYARTCNVSCSFSCVSTCGGGYCTTRECTDIESGMCGGWVTSWADCYTPNCSNCSSGICELPTCDGGDYCILPSPTPTPTPTPAPGCIGEGNCLPPGENCCSGLIEGWDWVCAVTEIRCTATAFECDPNGPPKCENSVYYVCEDGSWEWAQNCGFGCDGNVCVQEGYCEDSVCLDCDYDDDGNIDANTYSVDCWYDSSKADYQGVHCVQGTSCVEDECHPVSSTCGGTLTEENCEQWYPGMGYVSHIDNCGGQDCGPPCGGGEGDCVAEYPMMPTLLFPTNGGVVGEDVTLSWERNGYGVGCPQDNSQSLYLEAGDSNPTVEVASLGDSVNSYDVNDLETGTLYYWKVRVRNGSLSMDSDIFSFNVNGLIEGYFFDSGGMSVCPADLSDPAYDSRKIGGGMLDITSGGDNYLDVTTIADGSYSQSVTIPGSYVLGNYRLGSGFVSTPDLVCDGSSVEFVLGGEGVAVRSFGFLRDYDGWWQAVGGDVYGGLGMKSVIPGSCTVGEGCQPYLIKADANGESGLAKYLSGSIDLGSNESASVGPDGWVANSGYVGQNTNHTYYTSKMALLEKTSWAGSGKPVFNPEIGEDYEIYMYTGTATIDFDVAANEKMIFMVGGDVDVTVDINVAEGGHLAVIASGSITFASNVGQVEGWWVGDSLNIESTGDEGTEVVFRGEGSFVGWNGVSLNRDRGGLNATQPAEEFVFRPDLMINVPDALKFSRYVWQEKAP